MTPPRMYFAAAALSTIALGVTVASGWGQDFPDGESAGSGSGPGAGSGAGAGIGPSPWVSPSERPAESVRVEANVQHADVTPRTDGDIVWN
ncbi:hypothetical protein ABZY44_06490 [Streptomyces sp. NPDC006544]|uniref:hypothetical protein n=1 Tax=Streptomyces sp. NPDC006544 TaxID=3154583 RepID=UPI0033A583A7